ncbi:hypothetical protein LINGRAHAP2_LOCUS24937 [Linum grandiflorum]
MGYNSLGRCAFDRYGFNLIRWRPLLSLLRTLIWIINIQPLFYSSKSYVAIFGKFTFFTFTVKLIMLRIIWIILTNTAQTCKNF